MSLGEIRSILMSQYLLLSIWLICLAVLSQHHFKNSNIKLVHDIRTLTREFERAVEFDMNEKAGAAYDELSDVTCSACIDPKRRRQSVSWDGKQHLNLFDLGDMQQHTRTRQEVCFCLII